MYKGLKPSLIGIVIYKGTGFFLFEILSYKLYLNNMKNKNLINFISGAHAGILA